MRIIVVGGPRLGKSTLAREYRAKGIPTFCGDPFSLCKDETPIPGVTYLPERFACKDGWSPGSEFVAREWFSMRGSWLCEGQIMARALRKWAAMDDKYLAVTGERSSLPADKIIVLTNPVCEMSHGQASMCKSVATVWREIEHRFSGIVEER